ncbi:MAG: ComF family protein [Clostridia bacterium]|nr:ComF family protein [Clostridia bacterium]
MIEFLKKLQRAVFPEDYTCVYCGREIFNGKEVCDDCLRSLPFNDGYICDRCGRKTSAPALVCDACANKDIFFDGARSVFLYESPVSTAIKGLKYFGKKYLVREFSREMARVYLKAFYSCDAILPVPAYYKHERERGYNQSELLSLALGERLDIPVITDAVIKTRDTVSQVKLSAKERFINLSGSFRISDKSKVKDKRLLVVDDVMTTGATLNAIARALKKAGAAEVYGVTVASVDLLPSQRP